MVRYEEKSLFGTKKLILTNKKDIEKLAIERAKNEKLFWEDTTKYTLRLTIVILVVITLLNLVSWLVERLVK